MSNNSLQAYLNADDKVGLDKFLIPPTKDGRLVSLEARHHRSGADRFSWLGVLVCYAFLAT